MAAVLIDSSLLPHLGKQAVSQQQVFSVTNPMNSTASLLQRAIFYPLNFHIEY